MASFCLAVIESSKRIISKSPLPLLFLLPLQVLQDESSNFKASSAPTRLSAMARSGKGNNVLWFTLPPLIYPVPLCSLIQTPRKTPLKAPVLISFNLQCFWQHLYK